MADHAAGWVAADMLNITQRQLAELCDRHEPMASASPPRFRRATCVNCGRPMLRMWHLWLAEGGFKKEVHMCRRCGKAYR